MLKRIGIWWDFVKEKKIRNYSLQVLPSILITLVSFSVVHEQIAKLINKYFIIFIIFVIVLILAHFGFEVHRAGEIKDIKLEVEEKNKEIIKKEDIIGQLDGDLDQLNQTLKSLPTDFLHDFSNKLKLDNCDRITFYMYKDNKFVNIGRYSKNSNFGKTINGNTFEKEDNYISKCYHSEERDFFIKRALPDPDANFDKYCQEMSKGFSKFDKEKLRKVTMKSRCYFARKIYNSDGNSIGVLMIESRKTNLKICLNGEKRELRTNADYEVLSNLIKHDFQYILQSLHNYIKNYY